ncbi:hypothetical protein Prudu_001355 [Prunus dulcis]|uniref:S-adenosyl-L-methionine-dependent methyltransferases superfamily protein n=1 Tax=Prunus dulcis TaxID=3755 RepID=A0A4Y1QNJ1_PRUDU|nr:hypothetical protein Prudu_001355 [Prunus dulcis]
MQFEDESFDVVVDKGGLDALMEPETNKFTIANGTKVNRVLKCGGKFICFSWAWSDVLDAYCNIASDYNIIITQHTYGNQACRLQLEALENENRIRRGYSSTSTGSGIAVISS